MNQALLSSLPRQQSAPASSEVGHATNGGLPRPVEVLLLQRSIPTVAHAVRITRRGHQTLVSLSGHLWWIPSNRVVSRGVDESPQEQEQEPDPVAVDDAA